MDLVLKPKTNCSRLLAQIFRRLIAVKSLQELAKTDKVEALHQARVSLKKLKALVRLFETLDIPGARKLRRQLRNQGRNLAPFRDQEVVQERLHCLGINRGRLSHFDRQPLTEVRALTQALHWIGEISSYVETVENTAIECAEVERALRKSHRRCKRAYRCAVRNSESSRYGDAEDFHYWRKRLKDYQYQLEFLKPALRDYPKAFYKDVKKTAKLVGEGHDWAVVRLQLHGATKNERKLVRHNERDLYAQAAALGQQHFR